MEEANEECDILNASILQKAYIAPTMMLPGMASKFRGEVKYWFINANELFVLGWPVWYAHRERVHIWVGGWVVG